MKGPKSLSIVLGLASAVLLDVGTTDKALGQCPSPELAKLAPAGGQTTDWLGWPVSVSGDVAVLGAHGDDENGSNAGAAYVYRYDGSGWIDEAKLIARDGAANDWFGSANAVDGDVAVIGAPGDDNERGSNAGSAYIYRFNGSEWLEEEHLVPDDGAAGDQFGYSVSVSGDVVVIGSLNDDDRGEDSGSAYVYRYDPDSGQWPQEAHLLADDGAALDRFGVSVSVSGDVALIGAYSDDDQGNNSGSAYVFRHAEDGNWFQEDKLMPHDGEAVDLFGASVSISGDVAVIGAYRDDDAGTDSGSAYVFSYDPDSEDWYEEAKLTACDAAEGDWFGGPVSMDGDLVAIGAQHDDDNGTDSGSVYIYRYDLASGGWTEEGKLTAFDGSAGDYFGSGVSVSGDVAVIGAYFDDNPNGTDAGSAYVFDVGLCGVCVRTPEWQCDGDVDGDGQVNPVDSGIIQSNFGNRCAQALCQYDLDCDGQINPVDSGIVQSLFGTCEEPPDVCP